jgi:hypothetical protein
MAVAECAEVDDVSRPVQILDTARMVDFDIIERIMTVTDIGRSVQILDTVRVVDFDIIERIVIVTGSGRPVILDIIE